MLDGPGKGNHVVEAFPDSTGSGDLILQTGGVERARIAANGTGTGLFAGGGFNAAAYGFGGGSVMPNGLVISQSGDAPNATNDQFVLKPRASSLAYPVPTLRPVQATKNLAFDLMPTGSPGNQGSHGVCWLDVCNTDIMDGGTDTSTARVAMFTDHVEFGSRGFGAGPAQPIYIGVGMDGAIGTAQIRITNGLIIIGAETTITQSSVVLGSGVALLTTATAGFVELNSMAGTPTGAYSNHGANVAIVMDTTGNKMWARLGGTWKSVTFA